ncbi:hypothetical protein [Lentilactobacillus curieae]|nr:hypothetical protein [Lentilactobacillus curieae]
MKRYINIVLFISCLLLTISFGHGSTASANYTSWREYNTKLFGLAKKQQILNYDGSNMGMYLEFYQNKYFKETKGTKYKYNPKTRTVILRYVNNHKTPKTKYNYRKLIISNGHKRPIIKYYYKLGKGKFLFTNKVKYWMVKNIYF